MTHRKHHAYCTRVTTSKVEIIVLPIQFFKTQATVVLFLDFLNRILQ